MNDLILSLIFFGLGDNLEIDENFCDFDHFENIFWDFEILTLNRSALTGAIFYCFYADASGLAIDFAIEIVTFLLHQNGDFLFLLSFHGSKI